MNCELDRKMANNGEFRSPLNTYDDGICAICLSSHVNKSTPNCGHVFCFRCLIDWCQIKLECPTCKQPFQNFRHTIQTLPTGDQIFTPDPPAAPVENPRVEQMDDTVINEGYFLIMVIMLIMLYMLTIAYEDVLF